MNTGIFDELHQIPFKYISGNCIEVLMSTPLLSPFCKRGTIDFTCIGVFRLIENLISMSSPWMLSEAEAQRETERP